MKSSLTKQANALLKNKGYTQTGKPRKQPRDWYYRELLTGNTAPGVK